MIFFSMFAAIIMIDPGHGGEDQGASVTINGKTILEKDYDLAFSKILASVLIERGHQVYLTRTIDRYISLIQRSEVTQKINPDIFISIHLNSSKFRSATGFEIFYLDNHDDITVKRLEDTENKFLEENEVVNQILIDLIIDRTSKFSYNLAKSVERSLVKNLKGNLYLKNRGVKPAIFYVLGLSRRPSILMELAFLSNASDTKKILDPKMQNHYALMIAIGIEDYLKE